MSMGPNRRGGWLRRMTRWREARELLASEAYELWAQTYPPRAHTLLMEIEEASVKEMLPDPRGRVCLDLACGSGRYLRLLGERGASRTVGLDLSDAMLSRARPLCPALVRGDLRALPLAAESFDVVVCGLAVGSVPEIDDAIREIARILRAGGELLYSEMHPLGSSAGWKRTFRAADGRDYAVRHYAHPLDRHLRACRAAGLEVEELREPEVTAQGEWTGLPAALVIRARKTG